MPKAYAEEQQCWILCKPNSWVYARRNATKKSREIGRLECGDVVYTDGTVKNGFLYIYNLNFELSEGWVYKGYVVYDEPYSPAATNAQVSSNGRVQARKTINGKRNCWVKDGQSIKVYMMSNEWSVTNKGFIKTEFIDTGGLNGKR